MKYRDGGKMQQWREHLTGSAKKIGGHSAPPCSHLPSDAPEAPAGGAGGVVGCPSGAGVLGAGSPSCRLGAATVGGFLPPVPLYSLQSMNNSKHPRMRAPKEMVNKTV